MKGFSGFGNKSPLKSGLGLKHKSDSAGFDMDKHIDQKPVDPDAPGTPGTPGYEPPVKPEDKIGMKQWYKEEEQETKRINK